MTIRASVACAGMLLAVSCGNANPLIGEWSIDASRTDPQILATGIGAVDRFEFTKTHMTTRLKPGAPRTPGSPDRAPVVYEIRDEYVAVTPKDGDVEIRFFAEEGGTLRWDLGNGAWVYLKRP